MWSIKLKVIDTETNNMVVKRGKDVGVGRVKEAEYLVTEDNLTLDGRHTMQHTERVSQKCTLETYMILLTNVDPNTFNKN